MTEAEAKAIEFERDHGNGRFRYRLLANMRGNVAHGRFYANYQSGNATEADLLAAGYVPASRLLAVEAELGPLEVIHQWARLQPVPIAVDQAMRALDKLRGPAAPPSPPVAPEPAQEAGGVERVTHHEAAVMLQALTETHSPAGLHWLRLEKLELYRQQQEQSERETAGLRERLTELEQRLARVAELAHDRDGDTLEYRSSRLGKCAQVSWDHMEESFSKDPLKKRSTLKWAHLAAQVTTAEEDRDAERTQKEALAKSNAELRAELSKLRWLIRAWATGHPVKRDGFGRDLRAIGLQLESERESFECCGGNDEIPQAHCVDCPEQPTEAAPVAKTEAPSELPPVRVRLTPVRDGVKLIKPRGRTLDPATVATALGAEPETREAPSEPAGWVPNPVCDCSGCVFCRVNHSPEARENCHCWCERGEPAPQPPATTGGADRPVMVGELAGILRAHSRGRAALVGADLRVLAEMLEKAK